MAAIDPTTNIGKLRLRLADWRDVQWLPDNVYKQTLIDCDNNLNKATSILAQYILAILSQQTRSRVMQIESFDDQAFQQFRQFIIDTVSNPAFMNISPIAITTGIEEKRPLIEFQKLWNAGYVSGDSYEYLEDTQYLGDTNVL